jgi:C-terminal processing protease CtpA/Prc
MSKFDLIYEKALLSLKEQDHQPDGILFKNKVTELAKAIKAFLPQKSNDQETIQTAVDRALTKTNDEHVMYLDKSVPKNVVIKVSQPTGGDSFEVTLEGSGVPQQPDKSHKIVIGDTQWDESIYEEVLDKLQFVIGAATSAVNQPPPSEGAGAQPGADASALPGVGAEAQPGAETPAPPAV